MKFPWYAHNIEDYDRKTAALSIIQHGAYRLLLDHYYRTGGPLEANASDLLRICRATDEAERQAVLWVLGKFFVERDGFYHNERADEEIAKRIAISEKRKSAGKKGGQQPKTKRAAKAPAIAPANGEATEKQLLSKSPPHEHLQSLSSSLTGKKKETARERAGVRKAPAPLAPPATAAEIQSLLEHERDWADDDPNWKAVKCGTSVCEWSVWFRDCRPGDMPGTLIAKNSFTAEEIDKRFGSKLRQQFGAPVKILHKPAKEMRQ